MIPRPGQSPLFFFSFGGGETVLLFFFWASLPPQPPVTARFIFFHAYVGQKTKKLPAGYTVHVHT